jgi:protein-tyrosine-phosphatase
MAETLFRAMIQDHPAAKGWTTASAGTWAREGEAATQTAQAVMRSKGLDLAAHRARRVTEEILAGADEVVVMERNQKEALAVEFPEMRERVWMLTELAGTAGDIEDPIGQPVGRYRQTAEELEALLKRALPAILAKSRAREEGKTGTG